MKRLAFIFLSLIGFLHAQTWQDVGGGHNNSSHGMCLWNNMLIDGGSYNSPCPRIAGWNGTTWSCFGGGVGIVSRACVEFNGDLIAVGDFWNVNQPCTGCNGVARWDGTQWLPLGTGFNNDVLCVTVWNGQLVAGGDFTTADGNPCDRVAVWNGTNWYSLGGFTTTFDNDVRALCVYNGELWAGGDFANAGGCTACDRIVKWNGTAWVGGNSGVDIPGGLDSTVRVLYTNPDDNKLYMGGHFLDVGGNTACSRVAVYDGSVWSPLGNGVDNYVRAIHNYNGNVIVGGDFLNAGGVPASKIAKWNPNTSTWSAMGAGMNDYVKSMEVYNGELYAGGPFTTADGLPRSCVAKWYEVPTIPPAAAFTPSQSTICYNQCISFTDNSTNLPTAWNWTFNGGVPSTSTSQNPAQVCYSAPGIYTVSLQACNVNGCTTTSHTISVSSNPQPTVTINPNSSYTLCTGNSVTLAASGASTYSWAPATGLSSGSGAIVSANPAVTTTYTVTGNSLGCTNVDTVQVVVATTPTVVVSPQNISTCPSVSVQLNASGANTYAWSPASGLNSSSGSTVDALPAAPTVYTVTGTAANGCVASATVAVSVGNGSALPLIEGFETGVFQPVNWDLYDDANDGNNWEQNTAIGGFGTSSNCTWYQNNVVNAPNTRDRLITQNFNFQSLSSVKMFFDVAYCRKSNATFSDTLVVYASTDCGQTWNQVYSKGGSTLATAPNQNGTFTPSSAQWRTDTVYLNSYIGQGNVKFASENRNHNGNNLFLDNINIAGASTNPPASSFLLSNDTICAGTCLNFADNSSGLPTSWAWSFQGGSISNSSSQNPGSVCWNAGGSYIVSLKTCNANGCDSIAQTVFVSQPAVTVSPSDTICSGNSINLSASGASNYNWSPSIGLSCTNCPSPVASPTATMVYTLTATNASGCSVNSSLTITVLVCLTTPFNSLASETVIYPNPTGGTFNVFSKNEFDRIEIYSLQGKLVYSSIGKSKKQIINSELAPGMYFVNLQMETGEVETIRIIVSTQQ